MELSGVTLRVLIDKQPVEARVFDLSGILPDNMIESRIELVRDLPPARATDTVVICLPADDPSRNNIQDKRYRRIAHLRSTIKHLYICYDAKVALATDVTSLSYLATVGVSIVEETTQLLKMIKDGAFVMDVRRRDERVVFGNITRFNVPVEEFQAALLLPDDAFLWQYGFNRPKESEPIVVYCRTNRRAQFAALLLHTCGFEKVSIFRGGVVDWHQVTRDEHCLGYPSYEFPGDPPRPLVPESEKGVRVTDEYLHSLESPRSKHQISYKPFPPAPDLAQ